MSKQHDYSYDPVDTAEHQKYKVEQGHQWRQCLIACIVSAGGLCTGLGMGWSSPMIPKLMNVTMSPLMEPVTPSQESWIGSLLLLGGGISPPLAAPIAAMFGRKVTMLATSIPLLIGWMLIWFARNLPMIYMARLLWGVALGTHFGVAPLYLAEISDANSFQTSCDICWTKVDSLYEFSDYSERPIDIPKEHILHYINFESERTDPIDNIRGALGTLPLLFVNLGMFIAYIIGPYISYWSFAVVGCVLAIIYCASFMLVPETPLYYIALGRDKEAAIVLASLQGKSLSGVQHKLIELKEIYEEDSQQKPRISDIWATTQGFKAFCMVMFLSMLVQLSGVDVLLFYMENLLTKIGSSMSPEIGTIVIGGVLVVSSCVTPFVVDRLGRRPLMISTSLGLAVCLGILGIYASLDKMGYQVRSIAFLPILVLMFYMVIFNLGVGPVPFVLVAEMFPPNIKSLVASMCSSACWSMGFVSTRFFGNVERALGIHNAFFILAGFCTIGFLFSMFMLPETKGKSLQEIQDILHKRTPKAAPVELKLINVSTNNDA